MSSNENVLPMKEQGSDGCPTIARLLEKKGTPMELFLRREDIEKEADFKGLTQEDLTEAFLRSGEKPGEKLSLGNKALLRRICLKMNPTKGPKGPSRKRHRPANVANDSASRVPRPSPLGSPIEPFVMPTMR